MKNLLMILLLAGIVSASLGCLGDTTPNLNMNLYLNCTNEVESKCWATVHDTVNGNLVGYYPKSVFGEDKIGWNTMSDGKFVGDIFIDDGHYAVDHQYTVDVYCFGTDNSSDSVAVDFITTNYKQPDQLTNIALWTRDNIAYIFGAVVILIVCYVFIKAVGWRIVR